MQKEEVPLSSESRLETETGGEDDPLNTLGVIRQLEVGPVRLERRRMVAPYRVIQDSRIDTIDLIYRFEEDVFTPDDSASRNLSSMLAAQVALNYGLFCDEMVFHGLQTEPRGRVKPGAKSHSRLEPDHDLARRGLVGLPGRDDD